MSATRRQLLFAKYSGAGNDFLIVDERHEPGVGEGSQLARALCRRGTSVGADGLVVLTMGDAAEGAVARMRLWNADGSHAEFSGNAARCAVRYLVDEDLSGPDVTLDTDIGLVTGRVDGAEAAVHVPGHAIVRPQRRLRVEGRDLTGTHVRVGVPFFVLLHDDPDELPVRFLGRAIRNHKDLAPDGANVDFVRVEDEQNLYFRVYERGVEAETLSSGTGSISAALAAAAAGRVESPVVCRARGGALTVRFRELKPAEVAALTIADDDTAPESDQSPEATPPAAAEDTPEAGPEPEVAARDTGGDGPMREEVPAIHYGDIRVEGETRRVLTGTAHAEALRLR